LLLYYMAVTANIPSEVSYASQFLRNRVESPRGLVKNLMSGAWPCPVAQFLLGDVTFKSLMDEVEREANLAVPDAAARNETTRRYRLMWAIFYDGVKSRAEGNEAKCLSRMREVYRLENSSI